MTRRMDTHSMGPVRTWGDDIRRRQHNRRSRTAIIAAGVVSAGILLGTILLPREPLLIWNVTVSAPLGLYRVSYGTGAKRGDMVAARVPAAFRELAAERHYIPPTVPLIKRVVGRPGDIVCGAGPSVSLNGIPIAVRRATDGAGRPMPWWNGCYLLKTGQYFLAMPSVTTSFDGRYFGISSARDIIGPVHLSWRR